MDQNETMMSKCVEVHSSLDLDTHHANQLMSGRNSAGRGGP